MNNSKITHFQSDKQLTRTLMNNFGKVLVFIFSADWNEESKKFVNNFNNSIPIFGEFVNVKYFGLTAEKCPQTLKKFQVEVVPTIIITQTNKKIIQRFDGVDIGAVFDSLERISAEHAVQFEKDIILWHPKVKSLVQSCPLIIFMKGTPANPQCGFTRTIVQIFKQNQLQYTYYDIIQDENMRYWVRNYSNWPTYPSVFINGKCVGGLDKIEQYVKNGQFSKMVPQSSKALIPQERLQKYKSEYETIVFIDGFTFQNKDSEKIVEQARNKYGATAYIMNIAIDRALKQHFTNTLKQSLPVIFHKGSIAEK